MLPVLAAFSTALQLVVNIYLSINWLKVTEHIEYKLLSLNYKVLTTTQPTYLRNLISIQPHLSTCSSSVVTLSHLLIENHKLLI